MCSVFILRGLHFEYRKMYNVDADVAIDTVVYRHIHPLKGK